MKSTVEFLSVMVLALVMLGDSGSVYGKDEYYHPPKSESHMHYDSSQNRGYSGGSTAGGYGNASQGQQSEDTEQQSEKAENYPFEKSEMAIEPDNVIGLRIKNGQTITLSNDTTYYSEIVQDYEDFSDIKFFSKYPNLMSVEFSGISFTTQGLENIIKFIRKDKVKNISFNDCAFASEKDIELLCDLLEKLDGLTSVSIKFLKFNRKVNGKIKSENISPNSAESIMEIIAQKKNLASIKLVFDNISTNTCENVALSLKENPKITNLSLGWTEIIGDESEEAYSDLAKSLASLKQLTDLDLSIIRVPGKSIGELFEQIGKCEDMKNLTLFIDNLKDQGKIKIFEYAEALAASLEKLTALKSLRLENMGLPGSASQALLQPLSKLKQLEFFNFSGNEIDKGSCSILGEAMKEMEHLKTLVLRGCKIESDGFGNLSQNLSSTSLSLLSLGQNKIGEAISNWQISECADLSNLDLADNEISAESMMAFVNNSANHMALQTVDLRWNGRIDSRNAVDIIKKKNNSRIVYLFDETDTKKKKKASRNQTDSGMPTATHANKEW